MFHLERTISRMRVRLGVSGSSPISAQVLPADVGADQNGAAAARIAQPAPEDWRPVPLPPCSAMTSGQARSASSISGT